MFTLNSTVLFPALRGNGKRKKGIVLTTARQLLLLSGCILLVVSTEGQKVVLPEHTSTLFQQEIIAKLTGEQPLQEDLYLVQRASPENRQLTADFLGATLINTGWEVEYQAYQTAHSNVFLDLFFRPGKGINVIGSLPASIATDQTLILGAHYDTERDTPGAVDNASGVALCLALAKALKSIPYRKLNVLIVFFDQEEDDEVGSREFVKLLLKQNTNVHSVHVFDLLGWDTDGDGALTVQSPAPFLEKVYVDQAKAFGIPIEIIGGASSDNKSFLEAGFPTVLPFEEMADSTPYLHEPGDTYSTVNFEFLANSTTYILAILKKLLTDEN